MRKFKFRVWSKNSGGYWVGNTSTDWIGSGIGNIQGPDLQPYKCMSFKGEIMSNDNMGAFVDDNQDEYIIHQFTGLQDPEGKDIYEGDILEISVNYGTTSKSRYGLVHYHYYEYLIGVYDPAYSKDRMVNNNYCSILKCGRVAGNVFENRDLLLR